MSVFSMIPTFLKLFFKKMLHVSKYYLFLQRNQS